jgi:hypothetical protein
VGRQSSLYRSGTRSEVSERLRCEQALTVIPGAAHPFDEPGALESAAEAACD